MAKELTTEVEILLDISVGDAGMMGDMKCPQCNEDIRIAESPWWNVTCECGYRWKLVYYAMGVKDE